MKPHLTLWFVAQLSITEIFNINKQADTRTTEPVQVKLKTMAVIGITKYLPFLPKQKLHFLKITRKHRSNSEIQHGMEPNIHSTCHSKQTSLDMKMMKSGVLNVGKTNTMNEV
jgi:hypothetical protein